MFNSTAHSLTESSIRYQLNVERAEKEAQSFSTDYLKGYLTHYISQRGIVKKTLTKVLDALCISSEPSTIVGYRKALKNRISN